MTDYTTAFPKYTLEYSGYFDFAKLYRLIRTLSAQKQYGFFDIELNEIHKDDDTKEISLACRLFKDYNNYVFMKGEIIFTVQHLRDVKIKDGNDSFTINEGDISMTFETVMITDQKQKWNGGLLFFLRVMLERLVYNRFLRKFKHMAAADMNAIVEETRKYLNLEKTRNSVV